MKLLFLGLLYNRDEESKLLQLSKCGLQGACNSFQWNVIEGLEAVTDYPVTLYHFLPVGTFPRYYRKLFLPTKIWSHREASRDLELGFINLPGIKQFIRRHVLKKAVSRWCRENTDEELYILVYSLYLPYLKVLAGIKKKYKKICACVIVPDLPNSLGFHQSGNLFIKIVKACHEKRIYSLAKTADAFVILTNAMREPLKIMDKPCIVMEGICMPAEPQINSPASEDLKIILYAGCLDRIFGLDKLVMAFRQLPCPEFQLWICGSGDYRTEIEKAAREDQRIKYFGYVAAETVKDMLKKATLLINPRANENAYTRYSFPSKTLEYMTAAKPVLMFKLDGIPGEYDDYLYYIRENTAESIKEAILAVCAKSREELEARGKASCRFVLENKNCKLQAGRILSLLRSAALTIKTSADKEDSGIPVKKSKLKVLQINITCQYGSTGNIVEVLHDSLLQNGLSSNVAYSAYHSDLKDAFKIESRFENYLRRALNRYAGKKYAHSAPGTKRLIRKIKGLRPDLIHLHNIQQNSIHFPMLMRFLKKYGVPVVYTLHDCWPFTGGCYHFTVLNCDGYKYGCRVCRLDQSSRYLCNRTSEQICEEKRLALLSLDKLRIICNSDWLKDCAERSFMKGLPIEIIYNGVDTKIFRPVSSGIRKELHIAEEEFIILGTASHWSTEKGLELFFQLAELLKYPYRIVLVGLLEVICPKTIITIPRTDDKQFLARLYSTADVFFNASREETFGLTSAEAMACATPVIAFRSTACAEVIGPNTGIVLETFDINEVLKAIEAIHARGKKAFGKSCVEHVIRNYTKEAMISKYLKVYYELLKLPAEK